MPTSWLSLWMDHLYSYVRPAPPHSFTFHFVLPPQGHFSRISLRFLFLLDQQHTSCIIFSDLKEQATATATTTWFSITLHLPFHYSAPFLSELLKRVICSVSTYPTILSWIHFIQIFASITSPKLLFSGSPVTSILLNVVVILKWLSSLTYQWHLT